MRHRAAACFAFKQSSAIRRGPLEPIQFHNWQRACFRALPV